MKTSADADKRLENVSGVQSNAKQNYDRAHGDVLIEKHFCNGRTVSSVWKLLRTCCCSFLKRLGAQDITDSVMSLSIKSGHKFKVLLIPSSLLTSAK
jgi:hypothetical protein